jgi:hypothetical protein
MVAPGHEMGTDRRPVTSSPPALWSPSVRWKASADGK